MTTPRDFNKALDSANDTYGSFWIKTDFHLHSPVSPEYEYKDPDAREKLAHELSSRKYGFAVVLKHQEFPTKSELGDLQKLCPNTKLIPGAEINVFVDVIFKKVSKNHFFHCILAVDPDAPGEYDYLLKRAKEDFTYKDGDYPAGFHSSIRDLGLFFIEQGALFLPAHLHQSKKPENSRSIDDIYNDEAFLGFLEDGAFSGLEVRQSTTASFFQGGKITKDELPIPEAVCVRSSDAHHHEHIAERDRCTWVQVENRTFQQLKAALAFRHRVRLSEPTLANQRIIGLHVEGSFFPDVWITTNPQMNALIGCKGSGKTSIIECLRFLFDTNIPEERQEKVKKHVSYILGSSGAVECLIERDNGEQFVLSRRADSPQRLIVTNEDGNSTECESSEGYFEITILGWHEIEAVADSPKARIELLDRIDEGSKVREIYKSINGHIESARDQLPLLQHKLKKLNDSLNDLWELQEKRQTLTKLEKEELLELQNRYEWFLNSEEKLRNYSKRVEQHKTKLDKNLPFELGSLVEEDFGNKIPKELETHISTIANLIGGLHQSDLKDLEGLKIARDNVTKTIDLVINELRDNFANFRDQEYNPRVEALPTEERDILTRQIQILEETRKLPQEEEECRSLHAEIVDFSLHLEKMCDMVCKDRDKICVIREKIVDDLNSDLDNIRLLFKRSENKSRLERYQRRHRPDSNAFISLIQEFGSQETYENMRELFTGLCQTDITSDRWKVSDLIWDARFVEFLDIVDDDDVDIALSVGTSDFISIQNLSAGQRCTAVFPILLRNAKGPLVIDQPEDNLDNRHIADTIAPDLLNRKSDQQFMS
jgi:recombinational DNA repair ATPase RecF